MPALFLKIFRSLPSAAQSVCLIIPLHAAFKYASTISFKLQKAKASTFRMVAFTELGEHLSFIDLCEQ